MKKRGVLFNLFKDKKGEESPSGEDILWPQLIFIVLNLLIFSILLVFVYKALSGAIVYEEAYSKQTALFLDNAEPGMQLKLDFIKPFEIAQKNGIARENVVQISRDKVIVKLGKGGYSFEHFSDYNIKETVEGNYIVLEVEKNA